MLDQDLIIGSFRYDQYGVLNGHVGIWGSGNVDVISEETQTYAGVGYLRLIADPNHNPYQIGQAYPEYDQGEKFFVVELDSPFLARPVSAFLFKDEDDGCKYNLVWNRAVGS